MAIIKFAFMTILIYGFTYIENVELESCVLCRSVIGDLMKYQREGMDQVELEKIAVELCLSIDYYLPETCRGYVKLNLPIFIYIIENRANLTEHTFCGIFLQGDGCEVFDTGYLDWSIAIDQNYMPIEDHKSTPILNDPNPLHIIQISDIHYDPYYKIGSNAVCNDFMCCRSGVPDSPSNAAQRWGGYHCDSPWDAVENCLSHIRKQHPQIDYIYFTGDIIHHSPWNTTVDEITESLDVIFTQLKNVFGDVPIFPVIGNHDVHPQNQFAPGSVPAELNTQWLYSLMADKFAVWLPEDTKSTIQHGGYYTVQIRPGFRVITINNNDCNTDNFWLVYDPKYSAHQLQWLHDILLKAEENLENVHILMHIPSGGKSCFRIWAREFRRIIDRFWKTISGIFTGHTHKDDFNLFYDRSTAKYAINVAWNGGSTTTITNVNPNYKVYHIETNTFQVIDFDVWSYNLTEANQIPDQNPNWFKSYTFRNEYNLVDLSPKNLNELVYSFSEDTENLLRFWRNRWKLADPPLLNGCNENCQANLLCSIVTTEYNDSRRCYNTV